MCNFEEKNVSFLSIWANDFIQTAYGNFLKISWMALLPNTNFLIYKKLYDFFYEWGSTVSRMQS